MGEWFLDGVIFMAAGALRTDADRTGLVRGAQPRAAHGCGIEEIPAAEAYRRLSANPAAVLIDVRTPAEWSFVGVPDLGALGKSVLFVSWQTWPDMAVNEEFSAALAARVGAPGGEAELIFLCRSGARSRAAAAEMAAAGYGLCCNVFDGFEGDRDAHGHRGRVSGWKAAGLPWVQT